MKLIFTKVFLISSIISLTCVSSCWPHTTKRHEESTTAILSTNNGGEADTTAPVSTASGVPETTASGVPESTTGIVTEGTTTDVPESTTTEKPEPQCQVKGECQGKVAGFSFDPTTIEECQKYCQGFELSPPITWVTYSPEKQFCECFENCDETLEDTCADCISSELDCDFQGCFMEGLCTVSNLKTFLKIPVN